jgi:hypothetical protein
MMKAQLKVSPMAIVEADGSTVKEVFERLAFLAEVLGHADKCGACQGNRIIPKVRHNQGFTFYELACLGCGAKLALGQCKGEGGVLFPKTRNDDGTAKPNGGWEKWTGSGDDAPQAPPPAQRSQSPAQRQPAAGAPPRPPAPAKRPYENIPF